MSGPIPRLRISLTRLTGAQLASLFHCLRVCLHQVSGLSEPNSVDLRAGDSILEVVSLLLQMDESSPAPDQVLKIFIDQHCQAELTVMQS